MKLALETKEVITTDWKYDAGNVMVRDRWWIDLRMQAQAMDKTNDKAPRIDYSKFKKTKSHLYYLNEYRAQANPLRIETTRGGDRCLWKARTYLSKMEETKKFLLKSWKLDGR